MSERIQRKRAKSWRMPEGAVYVGRPSRWGNPFRATMPNPIDSFRRDLTDGLLPITTGDVWRELRGKDLACWCPLDQACHADVLLEIANAPDCPACDGGGVDLFAGDAGEFCEQVRRHWCSAVTSAEPDEREAQ